MEKLIELIWEWQKETNPDGIYLPVVAYRDWIFWSDSDCLSSVMDEIHLISKSCRFILWLVENDKIDKRKIDTRLVRYVENYYDEDWYWVESSYEDYSDTDTLLMLLSISSSPIDDLISYLR